ncbi:hypothetical protein ZWY2020_036415 [Hordeum vulgare]|nr:hypothetical protein ZWY2020_036415 [Hordeum vulgare]
MTGDGDGDRLKGHRPRRRSAATAVASERSVARARCSRATDGKRRLRRVYYLASLPLAAAAPPCSLPPPPPPAVHLPAARAAGCLLTRLGTRRSKVTAADRAIPLSRRKAHM